MWWGRCGNLENEKVFVKAIIEKTLQTALQQLEYWENVPQSKLQLERTKHKDHGDFASNVALMLAKPLSKNPRELAELIIETMVLPAEIEKVEIAGPGFINFFLAAGTQQSVINAILFENGNYGRCDLGRGQRVNVEFVSSNPTGPLHVGHGRGAAYGSVLSNILAFAGFDVDREYYVNDAGRQMAILATSLWLRYLALCGESIAFPSNGYQGDYVIDIAKDLLKQQGERFKRDALAVFDSVPADEMDGQGDKEAHIDGLIANAKKLLGDDFEIIHQTVLQAILSDIQQDLTEFKVEYQNWFSEKQLETQGEIQAALDRLQQGGYLYQKDGATWFKSTEFGDDKDRVVVRENGQTTYFASDAAYLLDKVNRGYDKIVYVFGADHHGYVARLRALLQAFGFDDAMLIVPLVQFAILYRRGKKVSMSTRGGEFVTLRTLREEVGTDAARYFYVMRKADQHLDFDLDLAKSQSSDNPVYYIQYAHARICSVFRQLMEQGLTHELDQGLANVAVLTSEHECALLNLLTKFPDIIVRAAQHYDPHILAHYLQELANAFHSYYNAQKFIIDDANIRDARLTLLLAVKQVIGNALTLLGISTPEKM